MARHYTKATQITHGRTAATEDMHLSKANSYDASRNDWICNRGNRRRGGHAEVEARVWENILVLQQLWELHCSQPKEIHLLFAVSAADSSFAMRWPIDLPFTGIDVGQSWVG